MRSLNFSATVGPYPHPLLKCLLSAYKATPSLCQLDVVCLVLVYVLPGMSKIWLVSTFTSECPKFYFLYLKSISCVSHFFQSYASYDGKS